MTDSASSSDIFGETIDSHTNLMDIIWGPGINIGIFLVLYSYRRYTFILHAIIGVFACLYSLATSLPILMMTGVATRDNSLAQEVDGYTLYIHYMVGITCLSIIVASTLLGIITRILNFCQAPTNYILAIKKAHMVMGYISACLCKCNIYIIYGVSSQMAVLLSQDLIFVVLIVIWKLKFPRMEAYGSLLPKDDEPIQKVLSIRQLDRDKDYCTFANYIYQLQGIKIWHPAGYQIIQSVKNKEIDRYIYGMLASQELPEVPIHSHSFKSLQLLGQPIAKLNIPALFEGFDSGEAEVNICSMENISISGRIYEMHLSKKSGIPFLFNKYHTVNQLGRYHSITLNNEVTRLYTSVNFLIKNNKHFMTNFFNISLQSGIMMDIEQVKEETKSKIELKQFPNNQYPTQQTINDSNSSLPILFKSYVGGRFTDKLVNRVTNHLQLKLKISQSKGEGLQFALLKPGKIIILAGGTGIYPFSDFIDLLFKSELRKARTSLQRQIDELSPILANNPFDMFNFELMAAFQRLEDIHPITLQQILYLSRYSDKFKLTLKLKNKQNLYLKLNKEDGTILSGGTPSLPDITIVSQNINGIRNLSNIRIGKVHVQHENDGLDQNQFQNIPNTQVERKNAKILEISQEKNSIKKYKIRMIEGGFQEQLESSINQGKISKVWICGPPKMNQRIIRLLRQKYANYNDLYHII